MLTPVHRFQAVDCRNVNRPNVHRPNVHRSNHHHQGNETLLRICTLKIFFARHNRMWNVDFCEFSKCGALLLHQKEFHIHKELIGRAFQRNRLCWANVSHFMCFSMTIYSNDSYETFLLIQRPSSASFITHTPWNSDTCRGESCTWHTLSRWTSRLFRYATIVCIWERKWPFDLRWMQSFFFSFHLNHPTRHSQSHMPIELEGNLGLNVIRPSNEILADDRATLSANVADAANSTDSQILPSHLKCGMWASLALATVFLAGLYWICSFAHKFKQLINSVHSIVNDLLLWNQTETLMTFRVPPTAQCHFNVE